MVHKILVPLDRSELHQQVFAEALTLAKAVNGSLMLLHVLSPEEQGSPDFALFSSSEYYPRLAEEMLARHRQQWQEFEDQGLELLRSLTDIATSAGIATEFTQNFGSPGPMICTLARTWEADLVVMGRRQHSPLGELLLGSVSNYVLHHAPCSVFVVHPCKVSQVTMPSDQPMPETADETKIQIPSD